MGGFVSNLKEAVGQLVPVKEKGEFAHAINPRLLVSEWVLASGGAWG